MLLAIVLSKWECDSADQLFQNLLKASREQGQAHQIINLHPKEIIFDMDASFPDDLDAQWDELQEAIGELNEMKHRVNGNGTEAIRIVTEGTITSDIDAIQVVDEHLADFRNSSRLGVACLLADDAHRLTDEYVEKAHARYAQYTGATIPKLEIIDAVLRNVTTNHIDADPEDLKRQMEEATRDIRAIIQHMEVDMNEQKGQLLDDMEKLALDVESKYQEIYNELDTLVQN